MNVQAGPGLSRRTAWIGLPQNRSRSNKVRALGSTIIRTFRRTEFGYSLALFVGSLTAGLTFGFSMPSGQVSVWFVGFDTTLDSFLTVLAVNGFAVTIMLVGVLTGGLLSSVFAVLLGNYLGVQTAVIVNGTGLGSMAVVTGPHAIFELTGFVVALAAALLPLGSWVNEVRLSSEPTLRIGPLFRRFAAYAAASYALVAFGALVEVANVFSPS